MTKQKVAPLPAKAPAPNTHVDLEHSRPSSVAQVDAIIGNAVNPSSRIAVPDRIDLGDTVTGTSQRQTVFVWNQGEQSARVEARVSGDPEVRLIQAPEELRSYRDPWASNDSQAFVFEHRATKTGRFETYLDVTLAWFDGTQEHKRIVLASAAHIDGDPTMVEQDRELVTGLERSRDQAVQFAEHTKRHAIAESEYQRRSLGAHEGEKAEADDLSENVSIGLDDLFDRRMSAVQEMHEHVDGFRRVVPKPEYDAMDALASLALEVASAAIPNGVAHILEPALVAAIEGGHEAHGGQAAESHEKGSLLAEGLRVGVVEYVIEAASVLTETGMEKAKELAGERSETKVDEGSVSADLAADFFAKQRGVLIASHTAARKEHVIFRRSLGPLLRSDPKAAHGLLKAADEALAAKAEAAEGIQKRATAQAWVRVVAQADLGVNGFAATTDMHLANQPNTAGFHEKSMLLPHDGIVDVVFDGDLTHPTTPVKIASATVRGVRGAVLDPLRQLTLGELGLPIRASGFLSDRMNSVTVVRDEAGAIDYVENTSLPWEEGRWLSKKAGNNTSARSEGDGARLLMEQEIMPKNHELKTDDETK